MSVQAKYDKLVSLKRELGHDDAGEYEIIMQVAHRMKVDEAEEEETLDNLLRYYEESLALRKQEEERIKSP